jgi:hypothetical protein
MYRPQLVRDKIGLPEEEERNRTRDRSVILRLEKRLRGAAKHLNPLCMPS